MSDRALSLLIHGPSKHGKTTFAVTTSPAPRLVLDVESASRFLPVAKVRWDPVTQAPPEYDGTWDTAVVAVHDFNTALKAYEWLKSGKHPFKSVILDSLSELQVKAQESVNGRDRMQTQHWGELLSKVSFFGRDLRDLTTHPTNPVEAVVITAMTKEKGPADGPKVQAPSLQGQIADQVPYWYDVTGYYYRNQELDPETNQPVDVRHLYIGSNPMFVSGTRAPGLPDDIAHPNIEHLLEQVFGPRA